MSMRRSAHPGSVNVRLRSAPSKSRPIHPMEERLFGERMHSRVPNCRPANASTYCQRPSTNSWDLMGPLASIAMRPKGT
jgi:hypothetical protein